MRGIGVVEARREARFTYKSLGRISAGAESYMDHLDDHRTTECPLFGTIDDSTTSSAHDLSEHEVAEDTAVQPRKVLDAGARPVVLAMPVIRCPTGDTPITHRRGNGVAAQSFIVEHASRPWEGGYYRTSVAVRAIGVAGPVYIGPATGGNECRCSVELSATSYVSQVDRQGLHDVAPYHESPARCLLHDLVPFCVPSSSPRATRSS